MNAFDFHAPSRIVFGWGRIAEIGAVVRSIGPRAFIVWGSRTIASSQTGSDIVRAIEAERIAVRQLQLAPGEPEVATIDRLAAELRDFHPTRDDVIVAIGGGSGLDAGKALAGLALDPEESSVKEFLEGVGTGRKIGWPVLPVVAVPTTAGTGSEATFNAVISSRDAPFKKSFRDHRLMPKVALIDPQLACSAPRHITAWAGMDALTQLIEAYISRKGNRLTRRLAYSGIDHLDSAIRMVDRDPTAPGARMVLARAAYLSGLALANGGLGIAHGVAAGLGAMNGTPHGQACATMLPVAMKVNAGIKVEKDWPYSWERDLYHRFARMDFGNSTVSEERAGTELVNRIRVLIHDLEIPTRLSALGVTKQDIPELVRLSQGSSLSGNPKPISEAELAALLESML
jgi:alcohol dehydrogenase class IV